MEEQKCSSCSDALILNVLELRLDPQSCGNPKRVVVEKDRTGEGAVAPSRAEG